MAINVERDKRSRKDGKGRIRVTVYRDGKLLRAPLEIHVTLKNWDPVNRRVKVGDTMHAVYNKAIEGALERARTAAAEHPEWTAQQIRDAILRPATKGVLLSTALATVLKERASRFKPQTRERLGFIVKMTEEALSTVTIEGLSTADVSRYREHIHRRGVGQNTLRSRLKLLRLLYHHACSHYSVTRKAVFQDAIPRELPVEHRNLEPGEIVKLIEYNAPPELALARHAFLLAMYLGGMRFGDLQALTPDQITPQGLAIRQGKSGAVVYAEISEAARAIVEQYKGGERVLPLPSNQHINEKLKLIARAIGINPRLSMHWARHAAADRLDEAKVDIRTIQLLFGHSTLQQTIDYMARRTGKAAGAALKAIG